MIETTDFLWPVCSPANLPEGEGINAVNWRRRELCSPGCCGAVITNLLFFFLLGHRGVFQIPEVNSIPAFPPFSPSCPISPLLSTGLSWALGPSETPFQMTWKAKIWWACLWYQILRFHTCWWVLFSKRSICPSRALGCQWPAGETGHFCLFSSPCPVS